MVQVPNKTMALEEFLKLPETEPASEFINGQIIQKPMPQGKHSLTQGELISTINRVVRPKKIALAFPELRCTFGGKSIVPDISVFTWERIPTDETGRIANFFQACPDWLIEILSPDQSESHPTRKILHGLKHGCQMGWLINPEACFVVTYPAKQEPSYFDLDAPDDILWVPTFASEMRLTVGTLFSWLQFDQ
jgi:Uma2 family endonuclease